MNHTIDATGKTIGRVASEAAKLLIGKHMVTFARNLAPVLKVEVTNAAKLKIAENKRDQKVYKSFSGYPGGLKEHSMDHKIGKAGYSALITNAVKGMLPKNRLQDKMLKNLVVTE